MGFDARWGVLGACCLGAPHFRERIWIVAHTPGKRRRKRDATEREAESWRATLVARHAAHAPRFGGGSRRRSWSGGEEPAVARVDDWWPVDLLSGVDDGMAYRVDRVAATGNGQVPGVAALAWDALSHGR
jgi:DNA (cytosine-5)-methyltransferase 1